jgi:hypothetical protein
VALTEKSPEYIHYMDSVPAVEAAIRGAAESAGPQHVASMAVEVVVVVAAAAAAALVAALDGSVEATATAGPELKQVSMQAMVDMNASTAAG